jgi:hypothetical protein
MTRASRGLVAALLAALALPACTGRGPAGGIADAVADERVTIVFVDVEAEEELAYEGRFTVLPPEAGPGLWAAIPLDIPPQRARLRLVAGNGPGVVVALLTSDDARAILSAEAAAALAIDAPEAELSLVALRREPRLLAGARPGS